MNRLQFKSRSAAALDNGVELGRWTRDQVRRACDCAKTTVQAWFNELGPHGTTAEERLPDAHDLHLLAVGLPEVAELLLKLVTDGSAFTVCRGGDCGCKKTLADGTTGLIGDMQDLAALVGKWRKAEADGVMTPAELADIRPDVGKLIRELQAIDKLAGDRTSG